MTAQRWSDDVGTVADEAGRLLESLRRAGAEAAASAAGDGPGDRPADDAHARTDDASTEDGSSRSGSTGAEGSDRTAFTCDDPVCQWCPVCRASAFVRRLSPETLSGLAELAGFAQTVLSDLARSRAGEHRGSEAPPEDGRG